MSRPPITILYADDDPDDRLLIADALRDSRVSNRLEMVDDGAEVLAYLRREGRWSNVALSPRPGLILLDLNMPKMDGREALATIKADRRFSSIPVVILTTSRAEADVIRSYEIGANSYIAKPVTFQGLVQIMGDLNRYWFEVVELPEQQEYR